MEVRCDSKGEKFVLAALKKIFPNHKFEKASPEFLVNPLTGCLLEYDFYCRELNLAFEYNGVHHYQYPNWTQCSLKEFKDVVYRDYQKILLSDDHGICCITIPYIVEYEKIEDYIRFCLKWSSTKSS